MTVTDKLLSGLAAGPAKHIYLPNLTAFHLHGSFLFHDGPLFEMLRTRTAGRITVAVVPLEIIDVTILHRAVAEADVQSLKELVGVHVSLRCLDEARSMERVI
jgi:hypothetical protein